MRIKESKKKGPKLFSKLLISLSLYPSLSVCVCVQSDLFFLSPFFSARAFLSLFFLFTLLLFLGFAFICLFCREKVPIVGKWEKGKKREYFGWGVSGKREEKRTRLKVKERERGDWGGEEEKREKI